MVVGVDRDVLFANKTTRLSKAEVLAPNTAPIGVGDGEVRGVLKANLSFFLFDDRCGDDVPDLCRSTLVSYSRLLF
jgi:hypothetical protein